MSYANNKGADQSAHLLSLISTFFVCCLDSMLPVLAKPDVDSLWSWAGQFVSYLVPNAEDRCSHDMAHFAFPIFVKLIGIVLLGNFSGFLWWLCDCRSLRVEVKNFLYACFLMSHIHMVTFSGSSSNLAAVIYILRHKRNAADYLNQQSCAGTIKAQTCQLAEMKVTK